MYTLSLHDALPIYKYGGGLRCITFVPITIATMRNLLRRFFCAKKAWHKKITSINSPVAGVRAIGDRVMKWFMGTFFVFATVFSQASYADMVCANTKFDKGYKSNLAIIDEDELIKGNNALFQSGTITCNVSFDYK